MNSSRVALGFLLACGALWAQQYVISTFAGGAPPPTPVAAIDASIAPARIATDNAGNAYLASLNCVFKLDANGVLTRVAGSSRAGYSGDGGPATNAQLFGAGALPLIAVAVDTSGNIYIADAGNNRVRKVSPNGTIATIAGAGQPGYSGDGGAAVAAQLNTPSGVGVDTSGNVYIADLGNNRVRKVSPNGTIATIAGTGQYGYAGDGGPAISAQIGSPKDLAVDTAGNVYIADHDNNRVRRVSTAGVITTVAGNGSQGYSGDGGPATSAQLNQPTGVGVDSTGNLYIADYGNGRIRKVSVNGTITTVAGGGNFTNLGDGGPATSAYIFFPSGLAVDTVGNLYIADLGNSRARKVSPNGTITTVAGNGLFNYFGDGGSATTAGLSFTWSVSVDTTGNVYFPDGDTRVRKVSPSGTITTVVGSGSQGFSGDGGPAIQAQLNNPQGVTIDPLGSLLIADSFNNRIRKVSPNGTITTVAGRGSKGYSGDGGPAVRAQLNTPSGVAVDAQGNVFIADSGNSRVRRVSPDGTITTVAGNGTPGYSGDGGPAVNAQLGNLGGLAIDVAGNVYIADVSTDYSNGRIRRVSQAGVITTIAQLRYVTAVAVDRAGNLYGSNPIGDVVLKILPDGTTRTIAGTGTAGYSGDGGPATSAQLWSPGGVAVDSSGNVFVADSSNYAIRVLRPTNQPVLISAVVDAANEMVGPISPGKIVVIYGGGLGPTNLTQFQVSNRLIGTQLTGTTVAFNGIAAPIIYTSATQVAAIVPYEITGTTAQVAVSYQGQSSTAFIVPIAASAPSLFSLNQTGAGQAAAINAVDGTVNTAANPVKIGGYISLFATGEGQTTPAGVDGKIASGPLLPAPNLKVSATVGGIPAVVQYAGAAPGEVAGVMQVNVQIPVGVQPGGYVPVVLQVGDAATTAGAVWIAVAGN